MLIGFLVTIYLLLRLFGYSDMFYGILLLALFITLELAFRNGKKKSVIHHTTIVQTAKQ